MEAEAVSTSHWVCFCSSSCSLRLTDCESSFPRGFREQVAEKVHDRDPTLVSPHLLSRHLRSYLYDQVLRKAINGMLPKNNLRKRMMRQLYLFAEDVNKTMVLRPA